jgi:hypothetical protein
MTSVPGVVMPLLAITLTTSTPRLLITLARWLRAATASGLSAPELSLVPGSQSPPHQGHELVAVGLLMLAGPVDLDELDRWRIGWERRRRGRQCRTAQPANNSHVVRTDRGAIQVLRRHCPEPARRFEAAE